MTNYSVDLDLLHRLSDEPSTKIKSGFSDLGLQIAALEAVLIVCCAAASQALYTTIMWETPSDLGIAVGAGLVMAIFYLLIAHASNLFDMPATFGGAQELRRLFAAWFLTFLLAAMSAFLLKAGQQFSRGAAVIFFATGGGAILCTRIMVGRLARARRQHGAGVRSVVVFFDPRRGPEQATLRLQRSGCRVLRAAPMRLRGRGSAEDVRALFSGVEDLIRQGQVDEIVVDAQVRSAADLDALSLRFRGLPVPVRLAPDPDLASLLRRPVSTFGDLSTFDLQRPAFNATDRLIKRIVDVSIAGVALASLWPLLLFIAIAIKLDSSGPVIFSQTRVGARGRLFKIHKFRSMRVLDDGAVIRQAQRGDPRVTRVGRWIRSTSLDELPQLFNVLKGDMSLVGPRPHALAHDQEYGALIETYTMRHHAKPGITGLAQVSGARGETPTVELMAQRIELDIRYIATWSIWLDILIMLRTFRVLASPSKVY